MAADFFSMKSLSHLSHNQDERPPNENHMLIILALLTTDAIFAYWPLLQFLLSPNAYLKDGFCKFVGMLSLPVLNILKAVGVAFYALS